MRISRLVTCCFLLCILLYSSKGQTTTPDISKYPERFVQQFYDWYVPIALADSDGPAFVRALKQKGSNFTFELFRALKDDADAQAHAEDIVGLDFDPFLDSQDPCERYEVGDVVHLGNLYKVQVFSVCSGIKGKKPDVIAEVVSKNGSWVFTNFRYPNIHSDLFSILRSLRKNREKTFDNPKAHSDAP